MCNRLHFQKPLPITLIRRLFPPLRGPPLSRREAVQAVAPMKKSGFLLESCLTKSLPLEGKVSQLSEAQL